MPVDTQTNCDTPRTIVCQGPWDLWSLVNDDAAAARLEADAEFRRGALTAEAPQALVDRLPSLRTWVDDVVTASNLPAVARLLAPTDPTELRSIDGLKAVVGYGLYAHAPLDDLHPKETLTTWSANGSVDSTAFHAMYLGVDEAVDETEAADDIDVRSPLPLNERQREVVIRARHEPVVTVSGPPGTGKSQTAAAVALDTVARGGSVLLATQSATATEVLADLLDRVPGPTPVLFGGGRLGSKLATKLSDGLATPVDTGTASAAADAQRTVDELGAATAEALDRANQTWAEALAAQVTSTVDRKGRRAVADLATALRAGRAVIIGDPRLLRFVSFVADADIEAAVAGEGTTELAPRLDVRRVSAFDLGASASAVTMLDEHYRSIPHLIGFSAHRF